MSSSRCISWVWLGGFWICPTGRRGGGSVGWPQDRHRVLLPYHGCLLFRPGLVSCVGPFAFPWALCISFSLSCRHNLRRGALVPRCGCGRPFVNSSGGFVLVRVCVNRSCPSTIHHSVEAGSQFTTQRSSSSFTTAAVLQTGELRPSTLPEQRGNFGVVVGSHQKATNKVDCWFFFFLEN